MDGYVFEKRQGKILSNVKIAEKIALLPDGEYEIEISKLYPTRTLKQNKWYWKVVGIVGEELGYTKDEMHLSFKFAFLNNNARQRVSTTELTTVEMSRYFEDICRFASEHGIYIPDPKDYELREVLKLNNKK